MKEKDLHICKHDIGTIVALITGTSLLFCPLITHEGLANGVVMGKVFGVHTLMCISGTLTMIFIGLDKARCFRLELSDLLVIAFAGITLATYDWYLNPEPEKLLFGGQLIVMWFLFRYRISNAPFLSSVFLFTLMGTGLAEAVWGMLQLYGKVYSNHSLFRLTGSFFNPGPYSGYLAVISPICLWHALRFKNFTGLFAKVCLVSIVIVLPAGMSRSAWMAAAISCGWVYWMEQIGKTKTRGFLIKYKHWLLPAILSSIVLIAVSSIFLFNIKRDSAEGRLLMWKVSAQAIAKQPMAGVGLGGFPAAYATSQAEYLKGNHITHQEKLVAGCPEYAFNEYLQIALEQGIAGLLIFVSLLATIIYHGIKNGQIGAVGGILSLSIFAFSSYPLQLPSFWILLVCLGTICITTRRHTSLFTRSKGLDFVAKPFIIVLSLLGIVLFYQEKDRYKTYRQWQTIKGLYNAKVYQSVADDYHYLHELLKHKPEFLFEEAQCLSKTGKQKEAIKKFERAEKLSGDPMILYMKAKCLQEIGKYEEAETILLKSIEVLPERLYPYYLLLKLYEEPEFYHKNRLIKVAQTVLNKEPKVNSTAIQEMKEYAKVILSTYTKGGDIQKL